MQTETVYLEPPLYFSPSHNHIWSTSFHPSTNILAASLIDGHIQILKYDAEDVVRIKDIDNLHKSSCRQCVFNPQGDLLATCGQDMRLGFINGNGQIAHKIKRAHSHPIKRVMFAQTHLLLSGDDNGEVKAWDLRTSDSIFTANQQTQPITGLLYNTNSTQILSSSQDGTIAIYDLRQGSDSHKKLQAKSDSTDEPLNGLIFMHEQKYLLAPTSQGSVLIYKTENIDSFIDRIQGHPGSVDAILKINEHTFMTGGEDGFVRGLSVYPNKILSMIGQHEEDQNFPVESISLSHCGNIVASTSHDNSIKFYDVSEFFRQRNQISLADLPYSQVTQVKVEQRMIQGIQNGSSQLFQDQDDSSDSDDDEQQIMEKKKKKKKGNSKNNIKMRQKELKKETQKKFFKDL